MKTILSIISIIMVIALSLIVLNLVSCSSSGGGGGGDDDGGEPPPSGTGADGVTIFWMHYGTGGGSGQSVQQTSDSGFIVAGYQTTDFATAPSDLYVAKTDSGGFVQWQKTFGGSGRDTSSSVQQTADGGYIVAGCFDCDATPKSFFLMKLDNSGSKVWEKSIPGSSLDGAFAVRETKSGTTPDGFIFVGSDGNNGVALIKTDGSGNKIWNQSFASRNGWDVGFSVQQTNDGGYAITGVFGGEICLIKTDPTGTNPAKKSFGPGEGWSVKQTADDGYVLAGRTMPSRWFGGTAPADAVVIRTDKDGNEIWRKTFGGAEDDEARSVSLTLDGGYIVAGKTLSYGPGPVDRNLPWQWEDVFLIKLDANGNTVWQKVKGHRPNSSDGGVSVAAVSDGGYVVSGNSNAYSSGTVLLAKFDKNGETVDLGENDFTYTVPSATGIISMTNAIDAASAGAQAIIGPHDVGANSLDLLIAKLKGDPVSDYCSGGNYTFSPDPSPSISTGTPYTLTFNDCVSSAAGASQTLNGTATITIVSVASGDLATAGYEVQTTLSALNITITETGGLSSTITGGMRYSRTSTGGDLAAHAQSIDSPATKLTMSETAGTAALTCAIGPLSLHDSVGMTGAYSYGSANDTFTVAATSSSIGTAVSFSGTMLAPVAGAGVAPATGSFRMTATDNSTLTATITNGVAAVAIDTNADGTTDGMMSAAWESLN